MTIMRQTKTKSRKGNTKSAAKSNLVAVKNDRYHIDNLELDVLMDYVLNTHHYFAWVNLPVIKEYALKVARMQGAKYPVLVEVNRLYKELASDIERHLSTQEQVIFPYIKELVHAKRESYQVDTASINLSSIQLELDHQYFVDRLKMIVLLLSKLKIANKPETTPSVLLFKLKAFLDDLHEHIHLENEILFPKALLLEDEVLEN